MGKKGKAVRLSSGELAFLLSFRFPVYSSVLSRWLSGLCHASTKLQTVVGRLIDGRITLPFEM